MAKLRGALLIRVNGVPAAAPVSSGTYASLAGMTTQAKSGVQVTPEACAKIALDGFNPTTLAGAQAAAVTFHVAGNGVSEVLIASSAKSASAALTASIPAQCAHYQEKVQGKTFTYRVSEKAITGIGQQARVLDVHAASTANDMWSLMYRGTGFVGAVTVVGPNASEEAVRELGQQAYAFAAKTLA